MPKIIRFHATGDAEVLMVENLPLTEPGNGEVRLKVEAIGLFNRTRKSRAPPEVWLACAGLRPQSSADTHRKVAYSSLLSVISD